MHTLYPSSFLSTAEPIWQPRLSLKYDRRVDRNEQFAWSLGREHRLKNDKDIFTKSTSVPVSLTHDSNECTVVQCPSFYLLILLILIRPIDCYWTAGAKKVITYWSDTAVITASRNKSQHVFLKHIVNNLTEIWSCSLIFSWVLELIKCLLTSSAADISVYRELIRNLSHQIFLKENIWKTTWRK